MKFVLRRDEDKYKQRIITVRIPEELHDKIKEKAWKNRTSMNRVCVSLLEQWAREDEDEDSTREVCDSE
jgi:predicted HicB family RNase H-like nuclease